MDALIVYFALPFAVWRLTHLITAEDGPFDLIFRLRKAAGNGFLGKLMDCFYCASFWVGLAGALVATRAPHLVLIYCLYYSGLAILIEKLTNKDFS